MTKKSTKQRETLMLIDDDLVFSTLLRKKIEAKGYGVDYCRSGQEALEKLNMSRHRLVLLDVMMPNFSGIETLNKIREHYSSAELPVIMITSLDENKDITRAFAAGANDYLVKPVNIVVALARIATQLRVRDLHEASLIDQQFQAIKAMIITYNHEINNPLAIALGQLSLAKQKGDLSGIGKIEVALRRIADIVQKIERFKYKADSEIDYALDSKMFKLE